MSHKRTGFGCCISYFTSAVTNNFVPLLFFTLSREFSLSIGQLGFIVTLTFMTQAVIDFFGAGFIPLIGYRKTIFSAHCLVFCGLIFLGILPYIINPYAGILISVAFFATGSGIIEVTVSPITEALPAKRKSASMNFLHSFYSWGQMAVVIGSTLYFKLFTTHNWRYLPFVWSVLPVVAAVVLAGAPLEKYETGKISGRDFRSLLKSRALFPFLVIMLCSGASELALSQWASYFAESGLKVSKTMGDILGPCFFALMMGISRVLYGIYGKNLDIIKGIMICSVLCMLSYVVAALSPVAIISLMACGLCGFSVGIIWPGTLSLAAHRINSSTAVFGILALSGDIGCTAGPTLITLVSDKFSLFGDPIKAGVLSCAIFPLVIILTIFHIRKNKI